MSDKANIWEWTYRDKETFLAEGGTRAAIIEHYEEFWRLYHYDPIGADLAIHHALEAARTSHEPRWELHLRHWRIQNWLNQGQVKRMLTEAIDLLDLAVDERVKDVPQRICAYHDVVECYVDIDPAGYSQEIKENAEHILSQLPRCYPCADCARSNLARAAAASDKIQEAEHWLAEDSAHRHGGVTASSLNGRGGTYIRMQQWENAERAFQEASKLAAKEEDGIRYLTAMLGMVRARLGKGDIEGAQKLMPHLRRDAKYEGGSIITAKLLRVEGAIAQSLQAHRAALDYFTRAARMYDELGSTRDAAEIALDAVEMARAHDIAETETAINIAARAVGALPPASSDLYQRLEALGSAPVAPQEPAPGEQVSTPETAEQLQQEENRKELTALEEMLQAHIKNGLYQGITAALFRLGVWHDSHDQPRAALDYFIWSAALERLRRFSSQERSDALHALKVLGSKLPEGTVNAALRAAEKAPPAQLLPMLTDLPETQWSWTLQAIATEVTGQPVVEPKPDEQTPRERFEMMMENYASMTALLVRFHGQADPIRVASWIAWIERNIQNSEDKAADQKERSGQKPFLDFMRGLISLAQGASATEVAEKVQQPFRHTIEQIGKVATLPVWRHPGNWPLDLFIEQISQQAVKTLRNHDEHRAARLSNLILRYELMTIDLRPEDELKNETRYLDALSALLQRDGQPQPDGEAELPEPYAAILAAVVQASQAKEASEQE